MSEGQQWQEAEAITPCVDEVREFLEIANDFTNPLEVVREAISNAFDAHAQEIEIRFWTEQEAGERILKILLKDDGDGMDMEELQAFFDLGNSRRRYVDDEESFIGEKGHGTKVYFNSAKIEVMTWKNGRVMRATMEKPFASLYAGEIPPVKVHTAGAPGGFHGTEITIAGYNNNRGGSFTHEILRDYVYWFTKFGAFEEEFGESPHAALTLRLKGLDHAEPEALVFGHVFPTEKHNIHQLLKEHGPSAADYYVKRWVKTGHLPEFPDIEYQAVFYVEGDSAKKAYNDMIRRQGVIPRPGMYRVQERYGLWLAKDFIPVERKNEWITTKGSEYTRFHAFANCPALRLTANRGSVENTPTEILADLQKVVERTYEEITSGHDWSELDYLQQEATGIRNAERDKRELKRRVQLCKGKKVAQFNGLELIEPRQEIGVYGLVMRLLTVKPDILPFTIVDYDSHVGVDALVKSTEDVPLEKSSLRLVEFKYALKKELNHLFEHVHAIVCWETEARHEDEVADVTGNTRTMTVISGVGAQPTQYFLDDPRSARRIPVYVLSEYLTDAHGIEFKNRGDVVE